MHAMKLRVRSRSISPLILNLCTRWGKWSGSRLGLSTPEKSLATQLNSRIFGLHVWSVFVREEKNPFLLMGIELRLFTHPVPSLVTTATDLSEFFLNVVRY